MKSHYKRLSGHSEGKVTPGGPARGIYAAKKVLEKSNPTLFWP